MQYSAFFAVLAEKRTAARIEVELLSEIVHLHHTGVGKISFKYFQDFEGAQMGHFLWLEDERTSAYEEPFNDAVIFINSRYRDNRAMRRLVSAKELMHVFGTPEQRTDSSETFKALLMEIEANPVAQDASKQYEADRGALWQATIALIPPWIRDEFRQDWLDGKIKAPELAARWWLPESAVIAAMGDYYEKALARFLPEWDGKAIVAKVG